MHCSIQFPANELNLHHIWSTFICHYGVLQYCIQWRMLSTLLYCSSTHYCILWYRKHGQKLHGGRTNSAQAAMGEWLLVVIGYNCALFSMWHFKTTCCTIHASPLAIHVSLASWLCLGMFHCDKFFTIHLYKNLTFHRCSLHQTEVTIVHHFPMDHHSEALKDDTELYSRCDVSYNYQSLHSLFSFIKKIHYSVSLCSNGIYIHNFRKGITAVKAFSHYCT